MYPTPASPDRRALIAEAIRYTLEHDHTLTDPQRHGYRHLINDQEELDALTNLASTAGIEEEALDELVEATASQHASTVNSSGLQAQLAVLLATLGAPRARRVLDTVIEETANSRVRIRAAR